MRSMTDPSAAAKAGVRGQPYQGVRTGGRSARVRQAVLAAAVQELTESGYESLTLPQVAQRAGVHLSTVHRRWVNKSGLILDVGTELTKGMVPDPLCDSLREDLLALAHAVAEMLREPAIVMVLRAAFVLPDDQLAELRRDFWQSRIDVAQSVVDRAVRRGELPEGTGGWDVVEPIHATLWMRLLITGLEVDQLLLERLVDRAIAQAETAPDR